MENIKNYLTREQILQPWAKRRSSNCLIKSLDLLFQSDSVKIKACRLSGTVNSHSNGFQGTN